jgi:hypothetical protein
MFDERAPEARLNRKSAGALDLPNDSEEMASQSEGASAQFPFPGLALSYHREESGSTCEGELPAGDCGSRENWICDNAPWSRRGGAQHDRLEAS